MHMSVESCKKQGKIISELQFFFSAQKVAYDFEYLEVLQTSFIKLFMLFFEFWQ